MGGVKQYNITELLSVSQPSSKNLQLDFSSLGEPLLFHCGSASTTSAIIAKLETSKEAAGEVLELTKVESRGVTSEEDDYGAEPEQDDYAPVAAEPKTVRWATDTSAAARAGGETATVLYDFDAQGDDELTVHENETVTVVDKENDEWWSVRNAAGKEGVVPAQYVQLNDGSAAPPAAEDDHEEEVRRLEEEQAAGAALEAERQRAAAHKAEERRAIERAARERQKQEEEDRRYAEELEAKEAAKAERRARRQQEEQRSQREFEMAKRSASATQSAGLELMPRREAARGLEPPKISKRPSAQDVSEVARSLPTKGKQAPVKPPENSRPS